MISRSTQSLPPRTTARDLFGIACAQGGTSVTFMGDPEGPARWWNWYMTTPDWSEHFQVQTVPAALREERPEQYPTARRVSLAVGEHSSLGDDAPGDMTAAARAFLMSMTKTLTESGCPDLRGEQYTI